MDENPGNEYGGPVKPIRINEIDGLISFLQSVDWKEPWFSGLAIFHVTCAILTVLTRNLGVIQSAYFGFLMILVFCAEYINEWAASNWNMFARQQYFDSNGLFISIVFSVPLLINCLVIVVSWLWDVGVLISNVKQMKIRQQTMRKEKGQKSSNPDSGNGVEDTKKER